MSSQAVYSNVLLKVSGEALMGGQGFGIDPDVTARIARDVKSAVDLGVRLAVVVGGGNIFRGVSLAASGADRVTGDHMGMMATLMNALALKMAFVDHGLEAVVLSAIEMTEICESFTQRGLEAHLNAGRVVIFAGGTGNPYFTTDSAAALRACEMGADALLKATQVDGIYSEDPKINPSAERFEHITHTEVLSRGLQVMDAAAVSLTREAQIPIIVFSIHEEGGLKQVLMGNGRFTLVND